MNIAAVLCGILTVLLGVYGLFLLCIALPCFPRKMTSFPPALTQRRFTILIPARNEEAVIGRLLGSIRQMHYPPELIDTVVLINNCTDRTEEIARESGARILRCNIETKTKGDVLRFAFKALRDATYADAYPAACSDAYPTACSDAYRATGSDSCSATCSLSDAYIIMDADNVFDPAFLTEINNALATGVQVVQGRRTGLNGLCTSNSTGSSLQARRTGLNGMSTSNSTSASLHAKQTDVNAGRTWISECYEIYYAMQNAFFNHPRSSAGNSASINGTGWAVTRELMDRVGFETCTITEDYEFTIHCAFNNVRIAYCDSAVIYDDYVNSFRTSMTQRVRWTYGILQCLRHYEGRLLRALCVKSAPAESLKKASAECAKKAAAEIKNRKTAYLDAALLNLIPFAVTASILLPFVNYPVFALYRTVSFALYFLMTMLMLWIGLSLAALLAVGKTHAGVRKNLLGILLYPLFMITWVPVLLSFPFRRNFDWTPIRRKN